MSNNTKYVVGGIVVAVLIGVVALIAVSLKKLASDESKLCTNNKLPQNISPCDLYARLSVQSSRPFEHNHVRFPHYSPAPLCARQVHTRAVSGDPQKQADGAVALHRMAAIA